MKLYDGGRAPNPRRVRIFLAEKGIAIETRQVDLGLLQQKSVEFSAINPLQQVPALVFDDGSVITESMAICRYFDALHPEPALFGLPGREAAEIEMWNRRIEFHLLHTVSQVFRHLHPGMKSLEVPQVPEWGEANKPRVTAFLGVLNTQLKAHRFAAGEKYSVTDITGLVAIDLMKPARLAVPDEFSHVLRWYADIKVRPSSSA